MRLFYVCLAVLLLALGTAGAAVSDPSRAREGLLTAINAERAQGGAAPLRLSAPLSAVAQDRAEELARAGSLEGERGNEERLDREMKRAGYQAQRWVESEIASDSSLAEVAAYWRRRSGGTYRQVLGRDFRDLGVGVASLHGQPLYTLLFAVPEREYYGERTAGLKDLAAVRQAVLDQVNAERAKARARPLLLEPRLDAAAQHHAQDMLARGYFAHESPEGRTVRQRSQAAGYRWHAIGENIAEGQLSVDQVVQAWMASPEHRRNILDRDFIHMGLGLSLGETPKGFRVVWCQTFGHP
ncbi:MAG: hypothetical protein QOJ16_4985 [Acidobacteriota bacterium]|jgi:uncharacterized protein YkwD|nr:hypothetical protein [Acidobacteriota bacterium]